MTNSDKGGPRDVVSEVDRRRTGAQGAAAQEADRAARLEETKAALAAHDARVREHERAIIGAEQVLASHKAALKGSGRAREALLGDIRQARKASTRAARQARQADAAYDRAVLANLIEKEKSADQRAHPEPGAKPPARARRGKVNREETSTGERITIDQG